MQTFKKDLIFKFVRKQITIIISYYLKELPCI